jgi:hypothetical protein
MYTVICMPYVVMRNTYPSIICLNFESHTRHVYEALLLISGNRIVNLSERAYSVYESRVGLVIMRKHVRV